MFLLTSVVVRSPEIIDSYFDIQFDVTFEYFPYFKKRYIKHKINSTSFQTRHRMMRCQYMTATKEWFHGCTGVKYYTQRFVIWYNERKNNTIAFLGLLLNINMSDERWKIELYIFMVFSACNGKHFHLQSQNLHYTTCTCITQICSIYSDMFRRLYTVIREITPIRYIGVHSLMTAYRCRNMSE
jgi:hypothetical protein